jgi:hypothetical protein
MNRLVKEMNGYIKRQRDAYNSLFLANSARVPEKGYTLWRLTFVITFFRGRVGGESAIMKERHKKGNTNF